MSYEQGQDTERGRLAHISQSKMRARRPRGQKLVRFDENAPLETYCYQREDLPRDYKISGPALIFQFDTTIFIAPDWTARVDEFGNLLLAHQSSS